MEDDGQTGGLGTALMTIIDFLGWVIANVGLAFYHFFYAITHPGMWLDWADPQAVMRVVYYGGSVEFFFVAMTIFLVIFAVGLWKNAFLWGVVRGLEGMANTLGRFAAWAGLIMVIQQVIIVFMQRVFARPEIAFGFGIPIDFEVSWWSEELKLYNAIVVALCLTYTFVQGGHVRVDLIYSPVSYRTKRVIDMFGSLFFMIPMAVLIWMYSWFFLWRHLIVPKPSASEPLERLLMKARAFRWNVETIGFSANGFNAYFLFKVLIVALVGLIFLQAWTFFFRSFLEWREGPESEGRYLDRDVLEQGEEPYDHAEF